MGSGARHHPGCQRARATPWTAPSFTSPRSWSWRTRSAAARAHQRARPLRPLGSCSCGVATPRSMTCWPMVTQSALSPRGSVPLDTRTTPHHHGPGGSAVGRGARLPRSTTAAAGRDRGAHRRDHARVRAPLGVQVGLGRRGGIPLWGTAANLALPTPGCRAADDQGQRAGGRTPHRRG